MDLSLLFAVDRFSPPGHDLEFKLHQFNRRRKRPSVRAQQNCGDCGEKKGHNNDDCLEGRNHHSQLNPSITAVDSKLSQESYLVVMYILCRK